MTERTEFVLELSCLGKLLWGEYVPHLKYDFEPLLASCSWSWFAVRATGLRAAQPRNHGLEGRHALGVERHNDNRIDLLS